MPPANYRAVMLTGRGGLDRLEDVVLPIAEPNVDEVRLAVRATGAGATDILMRRGRYMFAPPYPFVLGYEVIGSVEALRPKIAARLPLLAAREAAELLERGGVEGKIVHLASFNGA